MDNPQYIEYLNSTGADIKIESQLQSQLKILESQVESPEKQELRPSNQFNLEEDVEEDQWKEVPVIGKFPFFLRSLRRY